MTTEKRGGDVTIDAIPPGRYPLEVAEANDALTSLPFRRTGKPPFAARYRRVLRIPSEEVGYSLLESLQSSTAFSGIRATSAPRRESIGWLFDLNFYFAAGH